MQIVTLDVKETLPEDEFWRDVESTNRCDDPEKALQFLSSLCLRRARWEATHMQFAKVDYVPFIESRARELYRKCRSMGFPQMMVLGVTMSHVLIEDS